MAGANRQAVGATHFAVGHTFTHLTEGSAYPYDMKQGPKSKGETSVSLPITYEEL